MVSGVQDKEVLRKGKEREEIHPPKFPFLPSRMN
jgi:hypothetical protein